MYRIHRFGKLTGLTPHVIRAWERRYGLGNPIRGENRYRLYTDEDVRLFRYLKSQVDQGMAIGELSEIGIDRLREKAQRMFVESRHEPPPSDRLVLELSQALQENDRTDFERKLNGALAVIPFEEALHRVLLPLQKKVGYLWHEGQVGIAQEHYASNHIRQKIFSAMNQFHTPDEGPVVIVACPENEWHEVAAMTAAYVCRARGCRVHYLGANLPIPELAMYCEGIRPSYVLLSITILESSEAVGLLVEELGDKIVRLAPTGVGGQGVLPNSQMFSQRNIMVFQDLKDLDRVIFSLTH